MYTIRFCGGDEHDKLIDFIKNHWRADHILVKSKDILDWQYFDKIEHRYNFIVAFNQLTEEFDAILGFIPTAQFDESLVDNRELWLAIWRVKDSANNHISGMNLLHFLRNKLKPASIYAIGISDVVKGIYKVLGYEVDKMSHFYIKNTNKKSFKIASFPNIETTTKGDSFHSYKIREISWQDYKNDISLLLEDLQYKPKKSIIYFENRYLHHNWLKYQYFGIFEDEKLSGVIVLRVVEVVHSRCLRIMDWIGNFLDVNLYQEFQKMLEQFDAEYIDFVCRVFDELSLVKMGFDKKDADICTIPEYFNPFVAENVDIFYCAKTKENYRLVKGDSDQDRPNFLTAIGK